MRKMICDRLRNKGFAAPFHHEIFYIEGIRIHKDDGENGSYIFGLPVVQNLISKEPLPFNKKVTFFVGENGTGKSTLLEAIAVSFGFNAEDGTRNFNFATEETYSDLCQYLTVIKGIKRPKDGFSLCAESFYNVASNIDKMDSEPSFEPEVIESYGGVSLHKQSHGESFMSLVLNRFEENGVYILDEPEAALSPSRQMTLLVAIDSLVKNNSQFIIATHSPILMAYPDADIFMLTDDDIRRIPYEETEQ